MQLSISRIMLAMFLASAILTGLVLVVVGNWVKHRSVSELAAAESRRQAELVFENLFSVMRKGWNKTEIDDLVGRINARNPDIIIFIHRAPKVAAQFGDRERGPTTRTPDPPVTESLSHGQENLILTEDAIRFLYPVKTEERCLGCHNESHIGDVNGVIDIRMPMKKLRVPLEYTVEMVIVAIAAMLGLLFLVLLLTFRRMVALPMIRMTRHMEGITASGDLTRRVNTEKKTWLYEVRTLTETFNQLLAGLEASQRQLLHESTTDQLTGLANRRRFNERLAFEVNRSARYKRPLALVMIDLDGFKAINDSLGHAAGDDVLARVADILRGIVRTSDTVARMGGDEFAIVVPETDKDGARILAAKVSQAITQAIFPFGGRRVEVGASAGVAALPEDGTDADRLLAAADMDMYAVKERRKKGVNPISA